jgi:alkanesulfonate monooxygenase SsuD/methylene tetrahydromethanopterin reductase-like flavin-dependent oxidoreductase (luciferase family)
MVTTRLRFFTSIYVAALRSPFQVAKSVGTACLLTGGRVSLGVGVGWCRDEFELTGETFHDRGRRTDDALDLMARLWEPGWTERDGGSYPTPPVVMNPRPRARIPVLVGGLSDAAMRRAVRHDGWVGDLCTTDQAIEHARRLRCWQAEAGEDRPLEVITSLTDAFLPSQFRRAAAGGVTQVMTMPWMYYYGLESSLEEKLEGLRRFHRQVVRKFDRA